MNILKLCHEKISLVAIASSLSIFGGPRFCNICKKRQYIKRVGKGGGEL